MAQRILVTGGAGFLGSHMCQRLIDDGAHVLCLDNFFTGQNRNLDIFKDNNQFECIEHDIVEPLSLDNIDQIYHLACPASPVHYQEDAVKTIITNVSGTINMLNLAKETGARLLLSSTSEVYGDPEIHPQPESYWGHVNPIGIRSCYDEGKRCAETLCFDYHRSHGVDIKVARIFNTYGPNMHPNDGRVVSNFIMQAINNEPITIYGDGSQTRSFCYVSDLINGLYSLMNSPDGVTGPINLGRPVEFTIKELAEKIIFLCNNGSEIIYQDLPSDDPKQRRPDITLAKEVLDWEPNIDLEEGLSKTIEYFKSINL